MLHYYRIFSYLIIYLLVLFVYLHSVHASVVLNEVAIQPNQIVELYNNASESADISSWYIDDSGGITFYTIPSQTIVPPLSCFLFNSDFNFNKSSVDSIRLFDSTGPPTSSSAKLIESYSYVKAPDVGYSFVKKMDGGTEWQTTTSSFGLLNESLTNCIPTPTSTPFPTETPTPIPTITVTPTPEPTSIPTPLPEIDYQNIYISEIFPYPPTGEKEWIELYNGNNIQVNLDGWYIDDGENSGSPPKSFTLTIDPYTYGLIELSSSLFNNDGDSVRLLDMNKNEKDSMEYGKISQGKSMGRISFSEDVYCEQENSKNTVNSPCLLDPTQIPSIQNTAKNVVLLTQKVSSPTRKVVNQKQNTTYKHLINSSSKTTNLNNQGEVLGIKIEEKKTLPTFYLSLISFSYSLLTIVSVFIKMKNA